LDDHSRIKNTDAAGVDLSKVIESATRYPSVIENLVGKRNLAHETNFAVVTVLRCCA
jgi:hypothetical protein